MGCYLKDLFNTARSILVQLPSIFLFIYLVSIHVGVHPFSSSDTTVAWKRLQFILSDRSDFPMTNSLLIAVQAWVSHVLISFSVDEILLPRSVNLSTSFRDLPFSVKMLPLWLKHMNSVLSALTWKPVTPAAYLRLCSRDLARAGEFARSTMSSVYSMSIIIHAGYLLSPLWLKHVNSVLSVLTWRPVTPDACFRLCSRWICKKHYVINVVRVHNCSCWISSAYFCQCKATFFH